MKQRLTITDVTQMPDGDKACVVGVTDEGETVRPVSTNGFQKRYLYKEHSLIVFPRAIIILNLLEGRPQPPHREDVVFDPRSIVHDGISNQEQWEGILVKTGFFNIKIMFDGHLSYGKYVMPGTNTRSIATLLYPSIHGFIIKVENENTKPRIQFKDYDNHLFDLPVNDLMYRELCYKKVIRESSAPEELAENILNSIKASQRIYLRVGLARPWKTTGSDEERCYPQVTGIYCYPDFLKGKTFADFI